MLIVYAMGDKPTIDQELRQAISLLYSVSKRTAKGRRAISEFTGLIAEALENGMSGYGKKDGFISLTFELVGGTSYQIFRSMSNELAGPSGKGPVTIHLRLE